MSRMKDIDLCLLNIERQIAEQTRILRWLDPRSPAYRRVKQDRTTLRSKHTKLQNRVSR